MTTNSCAHNYPVGQWGARVKINPRKQWYAQTGLFQVNPDQGDADKGFDLRLTGTGVLVPLGVGWLPGNDTKQFPGMYKLGGYYNSSDTPDALDDINGFSAGLTGSPFITHSGRFGAYAIANQVIQRDSSDSQTFLRVGAICGVADRATAVFRYFVATGGIHQGGFWHRDADFVSVLFAYARTNPRLIQYQQDRNPVVPGSTGIQTYESIAEVDYNFQIAPWLSVRPNLQYIIRPGGAGQIPNAVVIGLHTGVTF